MIWGYLAFRAIKSKIYREGFLARLGFVDNLGFVDKTIAAGGILLHCASVGEVRAAMPLIEKLISAYPNLSITIATTTPTGKQALKPVAHQINHCYFPIDWPGSCQRFIERLQPKLVILMETELWPNFLNLCDKNKIPTLLANARLSDKSLKNYLKYPKLTQPMLAKVNHICAQYDLDKNNFMQLGVKQKNMSQVGNIKFDIQLSQEIKKAQQKLKQSWVNGRLVWVAASIHPDEFELIIDTHLALLKKHPDLLLIAIPRHPEKFSEFKTLCIQNKINFICRSEKIIPNQHVSLVVGDTMGEMLLFLGLADVTFMGGSLISRGGHNPLESIVCGVPVIMGNSYYNFNDVCKKLIEKQVLTIVHSENELLTQLDSLVKQQDLLSNASKQCLNVMAENQGASDKMLLQIKKILAS